jgi:hypothetical protein
MNSRKVFSLKPSWLKYTEELPTRSSSAPPDQKKKNQRPPAEPTLKNEKNKVNKSESNFLQKVLKIIVLLVHEKIIRT